MKRTIALVGNPNCGKTALFNELTGSSQYVGNWPGVTVEHKGGTLRDTTDVTVIDLPGIYSILPYTPEERVTREYILNDKPELILNVIDATNLERNLYLSSQLLDLGVPMIMALNMSDLVKDPIDIEKLSAEFGCPIIEVSALKKTGLDQLCARLTAELPEAAPCFDLGESLESIISQVTSSLNISRADAIEYIQCEHEQLSEKKLSDEQHSLIEELVREIEEDRDDDIASLVASARYDSIVKIVRGVQQKQPAQSPFSQKVDAVLTNRFLGLAVFAAVMWSIYYISISTVGDWGTAWANDTIFGPVVGGWLDGFIGAGHAPIESLTMFTAVLSSCLVFPAALRRLHDIGFNGSWLYLAIAPFLLEYMCPHLPDALHTGIMYALYAINVVMLLALLLMPGQQKENRYGLATHRFRFRPMHLSGRLGRLDCVGYFILMSAIAFGIAMLGRLGLQVSDQVYSLIADGIVAGVGAVLGFLPQMAVLFLMLAFLEDCGYMARVAFMMDRIFRSLGLSGKSFIPLLVSMGCGIPGVMATRTIENEKDRRMTAMLTTFMPCGAKLPIIALIGLLLGQDQNIATLAYFTGIGSVILSGLLLKKMRYFSGGYTPFLMELPAYHMPSGASINLRAMERCKSFVQRAGTIIFIASAAIWFTQSYNWKMQQVESIHESMLADVGNAVTPVFAPLGWGDDWRPTVATVTGLIAKEQVIGTFGVLYSDDAEEAPAEAPAEGGEEAAAEEEEFARTAALPKYNALTSLSMLAWQLDSEVQAPLPPAEEAAEGEEEGEEVGVAARLKELGTFSTYAALSFMIFNLLCAPCFAACGAIRREMNSGFWTCFAIGYMCLWAYFTGFIVYQLGSGIQQGAFGAGQIVASILLAIIIYRLSPLCGRCKK